MKPAAMPKSLRPIPSLLAVVLLAGGLALGHDATAGKVYKWTDKDGVTHYTDSPPEQGQAFESRTIRPDENRPATQDAEDGAAAAAAPPAAANEDPVSRHCSQARANLATLEGAAAVNMDLDGDDEAEQLTPEQRLQQIELARRQVQAFCGEAAGSGGPGSPPAG